MNHKVDTKNPHISYKPSFTLSKVLRVRNKKIISIIRQYNLAQNRKILDFGCGRGDLLCLLKEKTKSDKLYGTDIDPVLVEMSSKYAKTTLINNMEQLQKYFPPESLDLVICSHVLEHIENPLKTLKILSKTTSEYLLIAIPNVLSLGNIIKSMFGRIPPVNEGHLQMWDIGHFSNLLKLAKLTPVCWETDTVTFFPHYWIELKFGRKVCSLAMKLTKPFEVYILPKLIKNVGISIIVLCKKQR